jgi:hypothetical protein
VTSNHGCTASASIAVTSNTPDLSLYPFGCDLLCDTVKIPGPIGPYIGYYTYQWLFNGVPIPPGNGINDTLTPVGSGTYTLILTGPGPTFCKDTTGPYNLSLKDCDSLQCHGRICGRKWNDANGNHKLNYGTEFGIPNWKICLVKCNVDNYPTNDTIACTRTDSSGFYCFENLCKGDYCVVEEHRPGWQQTWPISPPFYHVTVSDSGTVNGVDFGNRKKCIDIWTTVDTIGIPPYAMVLPQPHTLPAFAEWPVRITYQAQPSAPSVTVFEGMITPNIVPIPFCKHGYYWIVRKHVANYNFDRIYINDTLRSDNGDSVLVAINDSTDGATVILLNVHHTDATLRFRTFTAAQLAGSDQGTPVKRPRPGKPIPMPNTANVIDEMLRQGGKLIAGLEGQVNANHSVNGYLYPGSQSDVYKTFNTKGPHTGPPHGLDRDVKDKLILRRQKSVSATKHNNRFLANLFALKINILASDAGKTPPGFGDLLYAPPTPVMWFVEGQQYSVRSVAAMADSMLTNWEGVSYQEYGDINAVIESLNVSFAGPLPFGAGDTATWVVGGKLKLTGAKALSDVPSLIKLSSQAGARIPSFEGFAVPDAYALADCYPNPFNPLTTIRYSLPQNSRVSLTVYDVLGREMTKLVSGVEEAGTKAVVWNANGFASGVYFYRLEAIGLTDASKSFTQVKKMLLLK